MYGVTQAARVWMHDAEVLANQIMRPTYTGVRWYPYLILQNESGQRNRPVCGRACVKKRETETMKKLQDVRCDRQLPSFSVFSHSHVFSLLRPCQPARCLLSLLTLAVPVLPFVHLQLLYSEWDPLTEIRYRCLRPSLPAWHWSRADEHQHERPNRRRATLEAKGDRPGGHKSEMGHRKDHRQEHNRRSVPRR